MSDILFNSEIYEGQFVILDNMNDKNVIYSSEDSAKIVAEVKSKNIVSPCIIYVPEKESINIL